MSDTTMSDTTMTVAVITDVFFDDPGGARLDALLQDARNQGAELALLPELPLNSWSMSSKEARADDAEPLGGPRYRRQAHAAAKADIAVLGGIIEHNPGTGQRFNTAVLFAADGRELATYRKNHLPEEPGFWETFHYQPGNEPPRVMAGLSMPLGVQLCSDANRPDGSSLLAAQGAELIVVPRATPTETYQRWRLVLRSIAVVCACYLISVNRPGPEGDPAIGGPSLVIAPNGEVLLETTDPLATVTLSHDTVTTWRREYPGYLPWRAKLYTRGWSELGE